MTLNCKSAAAYIPWSSKYNYFQISWKSIKTEWFFLLKTSLNFIKKLELSCSVRRCQISLNLAGSSGSSQMAPPSSNVNLLTELCHSIFITSSSQYFQMYIHPSIEFFFYRRFDKINNLVILWNHNIFLYYNSLVIYSSVSTLFINIYYNFSWTDYYKRPLVKIEQTFITLKLFGKPQGVLLIWYN